MRSSTVRSMESPACAEPGRVSLRHRESGSRGDAVREAAAAGPSLAPIQRITGLGTTTIMRIVGKARLLW
jgi:hypothetical protein